MEVGLFRTSTLSKVCGSSVFKQLIKWSQGFIISVLLTETNYSTALLQSTDWLLQSPGFLHWLNEVRYNDGFSTIGEVISPPQEVLICCFREEFTSLSLKACFLVFLCLLRFIQQISRGGLRVFPSAGVGPSLLPSHGGNNRELASKHQVLPACFLHLRPHRRVWREGKLVKRNLTLIFIHKHLHCCIR